MQLQKMRQFLPNSKQGISRHKASESGLIKESFFSTRAAEQLAATVYRALYFFSTAHVKLVRHRQVKVAR